MTLWVIILSSFLIWMYLLFFRGMFWLNREREKDFSTQLKSTSWPPIVAIIPSRNESETLPITLPSLLEQDYPGSLSIIVVDDESEDGTYDIANNIANNSKRHLSVIHGSRLPATGWTGKLWSLHQGILASNKEQFPCKYYLFTDADILYEKQSIRNIVLQAEESGTLLTSLMVKLHCGSLSEIFLIPAFVFFFNMIYPFSWVNRKDIKTAAAAGGCALIDKQALESAGGLLPIKSALIDDCALAKKIKCFGPIWLGFANTVRSIRKYPKWNDIRAMVSRTAFSQLNNSFFILFGTVFGMGLTFLSPLILTFIGPHPVNCFAFLTLVGMSLSFIPTLLYYKVSPFFSFMLPFIAVCYIIFTLDSALQNLRGKGGYWKGRLQAKKIHHDRITRS